MKRKGQYSMKNGKFGTHTLYLKVIDLKVNRANLSWIVEMCISLATFIRANRYSILRKDIILNFFFIVCFEYYVRQKRESHRYCAPFVLDKFKSSSLFPHTSNTSYTVITIFFSFNYTLFGMKLFLYLPQRNVLQFI